MNTELKHTIYVGSEAVIKSIAERGHIRVLNPGTMRWQNFGKSAKYEAVKDPDVKTGWMLVCDRDIKTEAKEQGFIL